MKLSSAYQKKAHQAFVNRVLKKDDAADLEKVYEAFPQFKGRLSINYDEPKIMAGDNIGICEYLYIKDETSKAHDFAEKDTRNKTVAQTVRANIVAYRQIVKNEAAESEDSEYKAIYSALKKQLEKYFAITAEYGMLEYYGDDYAAIAKEYENNQKEAKQKRQAKEQDE